MTKTVKHGLKARGKMQPRTVVLSNCTAVRSISSIRQQLKEFLPAKQQAAALAVMTDLSLSYCEKFLAGRRDINLELYRALLHSEFGPTLIAAEFPEGQPAPQYIKRFRHGMQIADLRKRHAEDARRIAQLEEGAADVR